jgi:Homoserine dehydrogenase
VLSKARLDLRLRAVLSRKRMLLEPRAVEGDWRSAFAASTTPADLDQFTEHLLAARLPHAMIIDCSGSADVADRYAGWLAAGIHVVTPNKQAGAGPLPRFHAIRAAAAASGARFRYEATVGAGLPVITTLRDLVDTGDEVTAIAGIFSGTLAWLFNKYDGSVPFSALVAQARAMGYTEPDPRDDLSGVDVARKLVILAREAGRDLSLEDVQVESLVPEPLRQSSVEDFMEHLHGVTRRSPRACRPRVIAATCCAMSPSCPRPARPVSAWWNCRPAMPSPTCS